jgi:hypothetical protein
VPFPKKQTQVKTIDFLVQYAWWWQCVPKMRGRSDRKIQSVDGELGSHAVDLGLLFGVVR